MKLYKFRSLTSCKEFERAREIFETGCFYCSQYSELNDPMEGVFSITAIEDKSIRRIIDSIYSAKNNYKICSFSGGAAFENPTLWGYYAGGFKGMSIEIEVEKMIMKKIKYIDNVLNVDVNELGDMIIKNILTTKLTPWQQEAEYRYLTKSERHDHKIGKITAIYFGNPYGNLVNTNTIQKEKKNLVNYFRFRNELIESCRGKGIKCFSVKVSNCKVTVDQKLSFLS